MDTNQVWEAIERERLELADFLETLQPEAWERPSLCEGWRVRHVVAHLTLGARVGVLGALVGLVRARGSFNRFVHDDAVSRSHRPPAQLIDDLRTMAAVRKHPPGTKPVDPLVDVLVHGQDIAIPLGVTRPVPAAAAAVAADRVWSMTFPFYARRRFAGRRLRATDADWLRGEGELVEAPIATILLLVTGRPVTVADGGAAVAPGGAPSGT